MPPKGARGAPRGRGRGRGRGGQAAADLPSASAPELRESDPESLFTIGDTPMVDAEPVANATPVNEPEDDQNDPNSSPATQPTETPAPTPVRLPSTTSNTYGTASSSGTTAGAARTSKFKPRIARTNAKEREEREAREREKENARLGQAAAAARAAQRGTWGRGRGGRGRGDAMGRGRKAPTASGPFAELPSSHKTGRLAGGWGGSGGGSSGGIGGGFGSGFSGKTEGKKEFFNYGGSGSALSNILMAEPQYPDQDDDAPRVDIEHINVQSDSEEDVVMTGVKSLNKGKGKVSNKGGLKPIRLDRREHKERGTIVNTEPAIKSEVEEEEGADVMVIDEDRSSKAPKRERRGTRESEVKIKIEPGTIEPGTIPLMTYSREPTASSPPPPDFKVPIDIGSDDPNTDPELEPGAAKAQPHSPVSERKAKPRRPSDKKAKMPVMQTEEDRSEWGRHLEDIEILRKELGGMAANLQPQDKGKNVEGGVDVEGGAVQEPPKEQMEDGRVYLFQFPPVLPKLYDHEFGTNPNYIMDDPDAEMTPLDLTKDDEPKIKAEEKVIEIKQEEPDEEELRRQREGDKLVLEEGEMGKLVLRESGEVELVWGGTNMKVGRGIETSFFSAGAVTDSIDAPAMNGRAETMAMGEVMGKFVVILDVTNFR